MKITRINSYDDFRFKKNILYQHGAFLIDNEPYGVEIISSKEAIVVGRDKDVYKSVIDEFKIFAPHIYIFYDKDFTVIRKDKMPNLIKLEVEKIQPSQFYINEKKLKAVKKIISNANDIVIQVIKHENRYICVDGHSRLYYSMILKKKFVQAIIIESQPYMWKFSNEAKRRKIYSIKDVSVITDNEYQKKWIEYCKNIHF